MMPSNISNVSFTSPASLIAPDLAVQQQQIERNRQLAQALRDQSFKDDQVAPGSSVSWTQGLARLANAMVARGLQSKADKQQVGIARQYAGSLRGMFGMGGPPPQSAATDPAGGVAADPTPQPPAPDPDLGPQTNDLLSSLPPAPSTPAQPAPGASPGVPPAPGDAVPPQAPGRGPWSLSGNPQQDMASYMLNPEEYGKQVVAAHAPVDMAKMVQQAQAALQSGDIATANALLANIQKQNYIAPVNVRQGGILVDPMTHHVDFQSAQAPEGSKVNYGPDGQPINITAIPGGAGAISTAEAAKAGARASFQPAQVFNPATGQMEYTSQAAVTQGAPGAGGAAGGGRFAAAPPLGAQSAYNVTGTNSANAFQTISDGAADVPNRIYALKEMQGIVADPNSILGPGSEAYNRFRGIMGTAFGIAPPATTNSQEFAKWANQYSARSAQELGLSGSDARVQIAIHATPNGEMTKPALASVIPQMMGLENAKQGYANAAVAWQRARGPDTAQAFRTQWNKVYDPQVYTLMAQGPQAFAAAVTRMPKAQAAQLRTKYLELKQIGALPQ